MENKTCDECRFCQVYNSEIYMCTFKDEITQPENSCEEFMED